MMTTMINSGESVAMVPAALLSTEKLRMTTNYTKAMETIALEGTTGTVNQRPGWLALPGGEAYPSMEDRLWRRPKPIIAALPGRLIAITPDVFHILGAERRVQA